MIAKKLDPVKILHLYPREMNIYGDMGNIITLRKRLEWRGYSVACEALEPGREVDIESADIIFGGGGQDAGQAIVSDDLQRHAEVLKKMADDGAVMLLICGMYQLFGRAFVLKDGSEISGIGLFDLETCAGDERLVGNVTVQTKYGRLVGFENHSGQTYLGSKLEPLGQVAKGNGNNTQDMGEGAVYKNVFGTYLHGSLLPKNPAFADELITLALARKFGKKPELDRLDDTLEHQAADSAQARPA